MAFFVSRNESSDRLLEFDHVVVLDGGWDRVGRGEDPDAPRRLYYVAMTRARQTLTLASLPGPHRLQDALKDASFVLHRRPPDSLPAAPPELTRLYPASQPARRVPEFRGIQAPRRSGAPRHCLSIAW